MAYVYIGSSVQEGLENTELQLHEIEMHLNLGVMELALQ